MCEETPWTGLCCLYSHPYLTRAPWDCVTCGMRHGVWCEPTPANDAGVPARELWLAVELGDVNRDLTNPDWVRFLEERYVEIISEAA